MSVEHPSLFVCTHKRLHRSEHEVKSPYGLQAWVCCCNLYIAVGMQKLITLIAGIVLKTLEALKQSLTHLPSLNTPTASGLNQGNECHYI